MQLRSTDYRKKVLGCWMGKNIGGTLGAPMEWRRQVNDVSFYTQKLSGEPLPNDDLDIQLVWLIALEEQGVDIDAIALSDYWCLYVTPHWAEYGTGKVNMRSGLLPPLSGTFRNAYRHSCGAFIRTEIWACIAPGMPAVAAGYALRDAILDHGSGEGTWAAVFTAALESAAFVVSNVQDLVDIGLSYIPEDCGVAAAVRCARECHRHGMDWKEARDAILCDHRGSSHMGNPSLTSPEDREKGFHEGVQGYDAPSNIAILVFGLLYGGTDFDKMICTTVNCGEDTDCTGATAGAIYGMMHGIDAIPERWITPIGRGIRTVSINLGDLGAGWQVPATIDNLTERTGKIARRVLMRHGMEGMLSDDESATPGQVEMDRLISTDHGERFRDAMTMTTHTFPFFTVRVDLDEEPVVRDAVPKTIRVTIENTYKVQANLSLRWHMPDGWAVRPAASGVVQSLPAGLGKPVKLEFELETERVRGAVNRCVLEITSEGRPTVMLVPVVLMNGNVIGLD